MEVVFIVQLLIMAASAQYSGYYYYDYDFCLTSNIVCPPSEPGNETCLPLFWLCDDYIDCYDVADEGHTGVLNCKYMDSK